MKEVLKDFVAELLSKAGKKALILEDEKDIEYGISLTFRKGDSKINLNVYHNKKGHVTPVISASPNNPLYSIINILLDETRQPSETLHKWKTWIGTDESGKGDLFGPLVACGFLTDSRINLELQSFAVKDSKKLSGEKVNSIALKLLNSYKDRIETIILEPVKYNELYQKFTEQGKKLNELLAWMHSRIILNMRAKLSFDGAVIDKFARISVLKNSIKDLEKIPLIAVERAERDPAVAAASILARYYFLQGLKKMGKIHNSSFPRGSGPEADRFLLEFSARFGKASLKNVVKLNFKNLKKVE